MGRYNRSSPIVPLLVDLYFQHGSLFGLAFLRAYY